MVYWINVRICVVYLMTSSIIQHYIASNGFIESNGQSGRDLIKDIPKSGRRDSSKPQKASRRIIGVPVEVRTCQLLNIMSEAVLLEPTCSVAYIK
jgi:hypothetical protein